MTLHLVVNRPANGVHWTQRTAGQSHRPDAMDRTSRRTAHRFTPSRMHPQPTPLGRGLARRVARQQREAALLATPAEAVDLDRLHQLLQVEAISMPAASAMLTALIAGQHARRTRSAA